MSRSTADRAHDRGVGAGCNGPTLPSILSELDGIEPIDGTSMNAFEDEAFSEAVKATGRQRLIIGGLHTQICLTFATVQALKDGYDVMVFERSRQRARPADRPRRPIERGQRTIAG
jgi:Isochorismatase family